MVRRKGTETWGDSDQRVMETRVTEVEKAAAVAGQVALSALEKTAAGFAGIHTRLDTGNGTTATLARHLADIEEWRIAHDALEQGRRETWGNLKVFLGLGFAGIGALNTIVVLVLR